MQIPPHPSIHSFIPLHPFLPRTTPHSPPLPSTTSEKHTSRAKLVHTLDIDSARPRAALVALPGVVPGGVVGVVPGVGAGDEVVQERDVPEGADVAAHVPGARVVRRQDADDAGPARHELDARLAPVRRPQVVVVPQVHQRRRREAEVLRLEEPRRRVRRVVVRVVRRLRLVLLPERLLVDQGVGPGPRFGPRVGEVGEEEGGDYQGGD